MKIEKDNPYRNVIDVIRKWCEENYYTDFIVTISTSVYGASNYYLEFNAENMEFEFMDDWYEGGDIYLLAFCPVDKINLEHKWWV